MRDKRVESERESAPLVNKSKCELDFVETRGCNDPDRD